MTPVGLMLGWVTLRGTWAVEVEVAPSSPSPARAAKAVEELALSVPQHPQRVPPIPAAAAAEAETRLPPGPLVDLVIS
jgi:hypothetical protein